MPQPILTCEDVWKSYHKGPALGIKEFLVRKPFRPTALNREWALREVNLSIEPGEAFGIIGHNGSGKSTLLSLLLGSIVPERGRVIAKGKIASLLELGAGFHPELSGSDNIFLYGSILGMRAREISDRFASIVQFSGLESAVEQQVRTYSAGMITRLGFATIAHLHADLLLIDEVLAVGDADFQKQCLEHLSSFQDRGGTLVIVSHDLEAVKKICSRGVVLDQGRITASGPPEEIVGAYLQAVDSTQD